jgi:hypothetical protein
MSTVALHSTRYSRFATWPYSPLFGQMKANTSANTSRHIVLGWHLAVSAGTSCLADQLEVVRFVRDRSISIPAYDLCPF